ncbi:hypothetical protein WG66_012800 [Moniliophthora roreri]|nr:hypothetical protein WG66_012800 [Moniliophthora roreri]
MAGLASMNPMPSPIQKVPPEILRRIFDFAKPRWAGYWIWEFECQVMNCPTERYNYNFDFEEPQGLPRAYNNFAHVCSHWRVVALDMSSLWTTPDFRCPALAQQMVKRTKAATLNIIYPFEMFNRLSTAGRKVLCEAALSHISRIGSLILYTNLEPLIPALSQAAPCLQSLALASPEMFISLPSNFLGRHAPLLADLSLHNCFLPRDLPALESLTSLRVHCGHSGRGNFTPGQLLGLLQRCSHLQELELNDVFPHNIECGASVVNLPCLRHLKLVSEGSSSVLILNHIEHPAETRISLWSRSIQTHGHVGQICSALRQKFAKSSSVPLQSLAKTVSLVGAFGRFSMKIWETTMQVFPPGFGTCIHSHSGCSLPNPHFQLDFIWDIRGPCFDNFAKQILDALLLTEVETVLVDTLTISSINFVSNLLSMERVFYSPNMRTAVFRGDCIWMLPLMLSSQPQPTHQPLFPSLSTLHLTLASFSVSEGLRLVKRLYNQ